MSEDLQMSFLDAKENTKLIPGTDQPTAEPSDDQKAAALRVLQQLGVLRRDPNVPPPLPARDEVGPQEPVRENQRRSMLVEADSLVNGDRNTQYGDPIEDFQRTADLWSAYLGIDIEPHDVAALMALVKLSRIRWSPGKRDSWVDLAGYAACGWECAERGR